MYSELARQDIVKIKEEIDRQGIVTTDAKMRTFRDIVIKSEKDYHNQLKNYTDFYSLSSLRDLLFHVQEHRFTVPQIKESLYKLGLKFCGFEVPETIAHFKITNPHPNDPYDLDKWHLFEKNNPRAFGGMYQFWCQKVK